MVSSTQVNEEVLRKNLAKICKNISQDEAGEILGSSRSRVSKLLYGKAEFSLNDLVAISNYLGITLEEALYGEPSQETKSCALFFVENIHSVKKHLSNPQKKKILNTLIDSLPLS